MMVRKAPKWLVILAYASLAGFFACLVSAAILSQVQHPPDGNKPSTLYIRLVACGLISFAIFVCTGLIYTAMRREVYSGIAGGFVRRSKSPVHFWLLLSAVALLLLTITAYAAFKFLIPS